MSALNWDPSMSLFGPWGDPPEEFRASGNARQRRKARRAKGGRCEHGKWIEFGFEPEQKCTGCAAKMARQEEVDDKAWREQTLPEPV